MRTLFCLLLLLFTSPLIAQNVAINEDGSTADGSALLDIQSIDKGILIPRMSSAQRVAIANPANGLLVFDSNTQSFWFRDGADWAELNGIPDLMEDEDMDTRIEVEEQPDEDRVRMYIEDEEALRIEQNSSGAHRFDTYSLSRNLFFGHEAGLNSSPGHNTFLGYQTGLSNTSGSENVFIGYESGEANIFGDDNVFLGYQSGRANMGSFNVFLGSRSGFANLGGDNNTFLGYQSGNSNTSGSSGTFVGHNAGQSNAGGINNTFIGQGAAFFNTSGHNNTFIGHNTGRRNRTGNRNTALGTEAMGPDLNTEDHGDDNVAVGYRAGFYLEELSIQNLLLGAQAGFNQTVGTGNILLGHETGFSLDNASYNIGVGFNALRNSSAGDNNIAIGDSSMIKALGSNNIAIGPFSGLYLNGNDNVVIGRNSGEYLDASGSVFIGQFAGEQNTAGDYNSFVGSLSGRYNSRGEYNSFFGHSAGDRNTVGNSNAFIGAFSGHGNTGGESNTAFGFNSLFSNVDGTGNVALGRDALANLTQINEPFTLNENTAVGFQSGHIDAGNFNTTIGARTRAGSNDYNIALGYEAATGGGITSDGTHSIAIGYQSQTGGQNSIAIGRNTTIVQNDNIVIGANANDGFQSTNAVGIGNDVSLAQSNSIILGNHSNNSIEVGIGTNTPDAKLHIVNNTAIQRPLTVAQGNNVSLQVWANRGAAIGSSAIPPIQGLLVGGDSEFEQEVNVQGNAIFDDLIFVNTTEMPATYRVAIDGRVACTELRVQQVNDWPDYVFSQEYDLMDLKKVKKYIEEYNHLPGVPSAKEVEEAGGVEVGNTQKILLKKIEELTLYILQLEQRMELLENQN